MVQPFLYFLAQVGFCSFPYGFVLLSSGLSLVSWKWILRMILKMGFKMHMATYIQSMVERCQNFDLSKGLTYRELVGSLLWIVLCVMSPELLRVKDLAKQTQS